MATTAIEDRQMAATKEPVEINCSACSSSFRLWVPAQELEEWEKGVRIRCVRCGREYFVKRGETGFDVWASTGAAPAPAGKKKAPAAEPAAAPAPAPEPARAEPAEPRTDSGREPSAGEDVDNVLFIEDDKLAREMARENLKDAGIHLLMATNSREAIDIIEKDNIKLIVTDLYLKGPNDPADYVDGEDLLQKISETGREIPAIITTGKDIIDDLVLDPKWFELRVKGFIQKGNPFWVDELKLKVKEVLYKD